MDNYDKNKSAKYFGGIISPIETHLKFNPGNITRRTSIHDDIQKNHPFLNNFLFNNTIHKSNSHVSSPHHPFSKTNPFHSDLF